jgi:hypothetical protein
MPDPEVRLKDSCLWLALGVVLVPLWWLQVLFEWVYYGPPPPRPKGKLMPDPYTSATLDEPNGPRPLTGTLVCVTAEDVTEPFAGRKFNFGGALGPCLLINDLPAFREYVRADRKYRFALLDVTDDPT